MAVAAAIDAVRCDIYTDVDGVYTTDPRIVPKARRLDRVAFEEMLEMASLGAKVLQVRSVETGHGAQGQDLRPVVLRRSGESAAWHLDLRRGGYCGSSRSSPASLFPGTRRRLTLRQVADHPGVAAAIFMPLAEANINVDMIIQVASENSGSDGYDVHGFGRRFRAHQGNFA